MMSLPTFPAQDFFYGFEPTPAQQQGFAPAFHNAFPVFTYEDCGSIPNDTDLDFNILSEYILNDDLPMLDAQLMEPISDHGTHSSNATSCSQGTSGTSEQNHSFNEENLDEENEFEGTDDGKGRKRKKSDKSKDQIDRRRERNKVLARKTRLRKKFLFESLQKQVTELADENIRLKKLVEQKLKKDVSSKILAQCKPINLPPIMDSITAKSDIVLDKADDNLIRTIQAAQRSFVITDPALPDNPIIFASQAFLDLCGYKMEEVLGRNCRFLQGPGTDQAQVAILRKGIQEGADTSVCLLNYRADGSTFYNQIFLAALRDANHNIINYVGVQVEVKPPYGDPSLLNHPNTKK